MKTLNFASTQHLVPEDPHLTNQYQTKKLNSSNCVYLLETATTLHTLITMSQQHSRHEFLFTEGTEWITHHNFILGQLWLQVQRVFPVKLCCKNSNNQNNLSVQQHTSQYVRLHAAAPVFTKECTLALYLNHLWCVLQIRGLPSWLTSFKTSCGARSKCWGSELKPTTPTKRPWRLPSTSFLIHHLK